MSVSDLMRRDWNKRARKNAFHYIASWRKDWDEASFLQSGEEDYQRLVAPRLSLLQFFPQGKTMLELGCGAGRMTHSFARRFEQVYALDISRDMLALAQQIHAGRGNIQWVLGEGSNLSSFAPQSVDFVFSYLVIHHMPTELLALRYIQELLRTLKVGGVFLFHFSSGGAPTMNWRGRLLWGVLDAMWEVGLNRMSRSAASLFGYDPEIAGKSWRGASIEVSRVIETVQAAGGSVRGISGEKTPFTWCCGLRSYHKD